MVQVVTNFLLSPLTMAGDISQDGTDKETKRLNPQKVCSTQTKVTYKMVLQVAYVIWKKLLLAQT